MCAKQVHRGITKKFYESHNIIPNQTDEIPKGSQSFKQDALLDWKERKFLSRNTVNRCKQSHLEKS